MIETNKKLQNILGLAYISKNLVVGQDNINKLNFNKLKILIYSSDLSKKYLSFINNVLKSKENEVILIEVSDNFLSEAINISKVKIVAVTNKGFSAKIKDSIKE